MSVTFNACPAGASYTVESDGQPAYIIDLSDNAGSDVSITIKQSTTQSSLSGTQSGSTWSLDAMLPPFGYDALMGIAGLKHILYVSVTFQPQPAGLRLIALTVADTNRPCP